MNNSLERLCAEAFDRDPSQPAIEFRGRWYNWGELRHVVERINKFIRAADIPARAPIALVARNRPSAAATLIGLMQGGRHIYMVYPFQAPASIARNLDQLKPSLVVIMAEDDTDELRAVLRQRQLAGIVLEEADARSIPGCERTNAQWAEQSSAPEIHILTSGTTGPPKQFPVSYEIIRTDVLNAFSFPKEKSPIGEERIAPPYLHFPIGTISGLSGTLPALIHGVPFVLADRFNVHEWHDYVLRYRPIASSVPPAGIQMILDAEIPAEDLASIKWIPTGAAPLDPDVHRAFEKRYGFPVLSSYGATEFAGAAAIMTPELYAEWGDKKFGSVGKPLPGIKMRVIDPDTEAVLSAGSEGLLEVVVPRIGPQWIRTSDIAVIDEDGFMFHRGRADGAIMRGGFKILPETIEHALLRHEAISAAGVVGIPDKRLGQVPAAVVQLKSGVEHPDIADLEKYLRNSLLATHIPAAWRFVDELPKNASFKIDRAALRQMFDQ